MKGTQYGFPLDVFLVPFRVWTPKEVKRIRLALGKTTLEFAEMFVVSESLVESWEAVETSAKHREVFGPAARLMWVAAELAEGKTANLIRLAASGNL